MHILDSAQTAQALPYPQLVDAVALAARQMMTDAIRAPERQVVPIDATSVLLSMPAIGDDISVTKLITVHGGNARHNLPAIQGEVIVFDTATGRRLALLDGPTVTARRTAAVTLLGIRQLAASRPASALLIGTGVQANAHAQALVEYFGISRFFIAGRNALHVQAFCTALQQRHAHINATAVVMQDVEAQAAHADVVIALTTSTMPVIPSRLPATTMAIGVGAFKPEMAELPADLLHARPVFVDHLAGAKHEAGDLLRANLDWNAVRDLPTLLAQGAPHTGVAPVFKTVGHAVWDLAAARVAVQSLG